jgi:hypothetical protein
LLLAQNDVLGRLDTTGRGVATTVQREFFTDFAKLSLTSTWEQSTPIGSSAPISTAEAAYESRRAALLAVFQENVVLRSRLLGNIIDRLVATRPGYLAADVMAKVRVRVLHSERWLRL